MTRSISETELYGPIKAFLENLGYEVKAEVRDCDVVAVRSGEPPVIVELKTGLTLQVFFQAIDRLAISDLVYIAVAKPKRAIPSQAVKLCRRLGMGLIMVARSGSVEVLADPTPYAPRKNSKRLSKLLGEFQRRVGDPNVGGSNRRMIMTAYRQDAMKCFDYIRLHGPSRPRDVRDATGVDRATNILRDNVYGWFKKEARALYGINPTSPQG
jgi:hypothetical protein